MKVESVREIDVDTLITELETKINKVDNDVKFKKYETKVNKQLLIDAVDVIRHYRGLEIVEESN